MIINTKPCFNKEEQNTLKIFFLDFERIHDTNYKRITEQGKTLNILFVFKYFIRNSINKIVNKSFMNFQKETFWISFSYLLFHGKDETLFSVLCLII